MIKTQIQLEEDQYQALKRASARDSRSMSEIIREALSVSLMRARPRESIETVAGKYQPLSAEGTASGLKPHDAAWAESIR